MSVHGDKRRDSRPAVLRSESEVLRSYLDNAATTLRRILNGRQTQDSYRVEIREGDGDDGGAVVPARPRKRQLRPMGQDPDAIPQRDTGTPATRPLDDNGREKAA